MTVVAKVTEWKKAVRLPLLALLCLSGVAASAGQAVACSIPTETLLGKILFASDNKRVVQASDCTFINGGESDLISGAAVKDYGNGRMVQMTVFDNKDIVEAVVTDCNAAASIVVMGIADWENATSCGPMYELAKHLAPAGVIDLTAGNDLPSLEAALESQKVRVESASSYMSEIVKRKDRFDVFCGCKTFYPDSKGADAAK